MNSEHFGEHLVNTLVNTFLREVNTMNTLQGDSYLYIKKKEILRSSLIRSWVCLYLQSVHCVHQQIQSVHQSVHKVFTQLYIFGGLIYD